MLNEPILASSIEQAYLHFMQQPVIRQFLANGGQVFVATEGQSANTIERLIALGHRHFAEKYLQESEHKYLTLIQRYSGIQLSYFGKLQTNKIRRILSLFHTIETIARPKEVDFINRYRVDKMAKTTEFFIQWNIGQETQKNGASTTDLANLHAYCTTKNLPVSGLMIIQPQHAHPTQYFKATKQQAIHFGLSACQMGFSADYEEAIRCGATRIRVARLFFGN